MFFCPFSMHCTALKLWIRPWYCTPNNLWMSCPPPSLVTLQWCFQPQDLSCRPTRTTLKNQQTPRWNQKAFIQNSGPAQAVPVHSCFQNQRNRRSSDPVPSEAVRLGKGSAGTEHKLYLARPDVSVWWRRSEEGSMAPLTMGQPEACAS